jgi:MipA family protein
MRMYCLLAAAALWASPAVAQDAPAPAETAPPEAAGGPDTTIGLGAAFVPDYEGSNDYRLIPGGALRTKIGPVSIQTRGLYVYADLISSGSGKVDIDFGPIAGVRLNRTGKIKDDFVDLLPERKTAVELGAFAGVSFKGLTNPYDSLGLRLDMLKDVGDAHESTTFSPNLDFSTPLSKTIFVGASLSADFVSDKFADYYFSATPLEAADSGLAAYDADGGMKNWKVGLLANHSLSGDLRHGLSLFTTGSYSRLVNDFKRSPIVSERGSASQWFGALGLAYSW